MKRIIFVLVLLLTILVTPNVLAAKVLTVDASETKDGVITVKGTAESAVMAVAINIYAEDGTTFITQRSTQVNDDDTFEFTESFEAKKYVIKVADYDGGDTIDVTVEPGTSSNKNAKTGDFIHIYIITAVVALIGLTGTTMYLKKIK